MPVIFSKEETSPDYKGLRFLLDEINKKWGKGTVMFATEVTPIVKTENGCINSDLM